MSTVLELGQPAVVVEHCLVTGNETGLRYGDSYDWGAEGTLTVKHTVAVGNLQNVRNLKRSTGGPDWDAVSITCSMVDDPAHDGRGGNQGGAPTWNGQGCVEASVMNGAGCDGLRPGPRVCNP